MGLIGAVALAALSPGTRSLTGPALAVSVLAYLIVRCIRFPVGSAWTMPTQLVYVPMLFVLPTPLVPLIVTGCSVLDLVPAATRDGLTATRLAGRISDCFYSLVPATVLVLAGGQAFSWDHWPLLVLAFGAQLLLDAGFGLARTWWADRVLPADQPQMLWLYLHRRLLLVCRPDDRRRGGAPPGFDPDHPAAVRAAFGLCRRAPAAARAHPRAGLGL